MRVFTNSLKKKPSERSERGEQAMVQENERDDGCAKWNTDSLSVQAGRILSLSPLDDGHMESLLTIVRK